MTDFPEARPVQLVIRGVERSFDLDDPDLPDWIIDATPEESDKEYPDRLAKKDYSADLESLQIELIKVQSWLQRSGNRIIAIFEGRDAAGKGGAIKAVRENMNPRSVPIVALPKPSDRESGQWYYQRYIAHFPTAGEFVLFDRSWYNRAGVERIMGFCSEGEYAHFLNETPVFERLIAESGTYLFKFWLNIRRETQLKRFHDRRHSPLKTWKLSPMDIASLEKWDEYTEAREIMFRNTHTPEAPWTVVRADDKRRARLNLIRHLLLALPYDDKDEKKIGKLEPAVIGSPSLLAS